MLKTLALVRRRRDHTREAFRAHYEEIHAPLALAAVLAGTSRYVRHHLRGALHGAPDFDVLTAFWLRDAAAARAVESRMAGPEGEAVRADEQRFMDRPALRFFGVTERRILGGERRDAGLLLAALVARPPGAARGDFLRGYESRDLPALLSAAGAPHWCLQNRALDSPAEPAFDAVTQLHTAGGAAAKERLRGWAARVEAQGARVILAAVSEHESEIPARRFRAGAPRAAPRKKR